MSETEKQHSRGLFESISERLEDYAGAARSAVRAFRGSLENTRWERESLPVSVPGPEPDTERWHQVWGALGQELRARNMGDGRDLSQYSRDGENWQYMGATRDRASGEVTHSFRHREHPRSGQREDVEIPDARTRNPGLAELSKAALQREREANSEMLGELTPAMKQRLDSPERDPIEYWERASDKTLMEADIIKSLAERERTTENRSNRTEIANGWTRQDAEAMNAHLDAKAAREWERTEPSHESVRRAERMADPTDKMHEAYREWQADTYRPVAQSAAPELRAETRWSEPTQERDGRGRGR